MVGVQLVEDFASYLYLPKLAGPHTLLGAIRSGLDLVTWSSESFAYAESHDENTGRYRGLRAAQTIGVAEDDSGMLVKPDVALRQIQADSPPALPQTSASAAPSAVSPSPSGGVTTAPPEPAKPDRPKPRRYHGTVRLDSTRVGRDASRIADEVIAHLAGQLGAEVSVTLEIEARLPDGASDQVIRIVTENGQTLKFERGHGFEED